MAKCRGMNTVAGAAVEVAANAGKLGGFSGSWKIAHNAGDGRTSDVISLGSSVGELNASFPAIYQLVDKRLEEMVELITGRLRWTWYNTSQVHIFWFIADIQRKVKTCAGNNAA